MSERRERTIGTASGDARSPFDPSEEELAAIVAAIEVSWPRAIAGGEPPAPPRWRFAGRWWSKPVPARRERPW